MYQNCLRCNFMHAFSDVKSHCVQRGLLQKIVLWDLLTERVSLALIRYTVNLSESNPIEDNRSYFRIDLHRIVQ